MNTSHEKLKRSSLPPWRKFFSHLLSHNAVTGDGPGISLPEPTPVDSIRADSVLWDSLSQERQRRAGHAVAMMAERFSVPAEQFRLVESESRTGTRLVTAVYGGPAIDLGDRAWNSIFGKVNYFSFVLRLMDKTPDGPAERLRIDTRQLTQGAYEALVHDAITNGRPLPDTEYDLSLHDPKLTGTVQPKVWLTGEPATTEWASYAFVESNGDVTTGNYHRTRTDREMRFRPAAII